MRNIFICALVMVWGFCQAQFSVPITPAQYEKQLKGQVNIVSKGFSEKVFHKYELYDGKVNKSSFVEKTMAFNKNGTVSEVVYTTNSSRTELILIHEYNSIGRVKRITKFHPTGDILGRFEYRYNTEGFLAERSEYDQYNYILNKVVYSIDKVNNTLTELHYSSPEMITKKFVKEYNSLDSNRLMRFKEYDGESVLKFSKTVEYKNGKIEKENIFNPNGDLIHYLQYYYDSKEQLSEIKKHIPKGDSYAYYRVKFNGYGLLAGEVRYGARGKILSYYKFTYR